MNAEETLWTLASGQVVYPGQSAKRPSSQVGKETSENPGKSRTGQQINHKKSTLIRLPGCPKNGVHFSIRGGRSGKALEL